LTEWLAAGRVSVRVMIDVFAKTSGVFTGGGGGARVSAIPQETKRLKVINNLLDTEK